jgi:hypothetical protein
MSFGWSPGRHGKQELLSALMFWGILRVYKFVHRRTRMSSMFERRNVGLAFECKSNIVKGFEQEMLSKRVNFELVA